MSGDGVHASYVLKEFTAYRIVFDFKEQRYICDHSHKTDISIVLFPVIKA